MFTLWWWISHLQHFPVVWPCFTSSLGLRAALWEHSVVRQWDSLPTAVMLVYALEHHQDCAPCGSSRHTLQQLFLSTSLWDNLYWHRIIKSYSVLGWKGHEFWIQARTRSTYSYSFGIVPGHPHWALFFLEQQLGNLHSAPLYTQLLVSRRLQAMLFLHVCDEVMRSNHCFEMGISGVEFVVLAVPTSWFRHH